MLDVTANQIQQNYSVDGLPGRIKLALEKAGLGTGTLSWKDLVPFDQFHVRGLEATKELAAKLDLKPGQFVLDAGSGFGGPARYLASVYGVDVTGIDLTPDYVEASSYLSERAGLGNELHFSQGDATELPFRADQFDVVWTQHLAMNIKDKKKLYAALFRVLKPGGRLAIYDAVQGWNGPAVYPTPWAKNADMSFLSTQGELQDLLTAAGFSEVSVTDRSETAARWFLELQAQRTQQQGVPTAPSPLSLPSILGPGVGAAVGNFARNVLEERVRILQVIARKD